MFTVMPNEKGTTVESADAQQIMELYARYCRAADNDLAEAWAECFTDDGALYTGGSLLTRGREEHIARRAATSLKGWRQHWNANIILEHTPSGDVRGTAYLMVVDIARPSGEPVITLVGNYEDEIVRTSAGWRFHNRRLVFIGGSGGI